MIVRELVALFGFKMDKKSTETVDEKVGAFFDKVKGLAALAGAAAGFVLLKGVAESVGRLGSEIESTSKQLGVGAEAFQELAYAAEQADRRMTRQQFTTGLRTLSTVAYDAGRGSKEAAEVLRRLGISATDSEGKLRPLEEMFEQAADGLQRVKSTTERAALAQKAFGQAGLMLGPMLSQGSAGIKKMRERAHELGVVLDRELLDRTREWDDSSKDVSASLAGLKNVVGRALLPRLTALNKIWIRLLVGNRKLIHSGLERNLDRLGQVVENVVDFFANLTERITAFLSTLTPLQQGLLAASAAALGLAGVLLLPGGSLLVLIGLIGLMIDDFEVWRKGGKSAIGDLIGSMDDFKASFPGVSDAAGSLWETLKAVLSGVVSLIKGISQLFGGLAMFLINVWSDPEVATKDFIGNIRTLWEDFIAWLREAVGSDIIDAISGAISALENFRTSSIAKALEFVQSLLDSIANGFHVVADSATNFLGIFGRVFKSADFLRKMVESAGAGVDVLAGFGRQATGAAGAFVQGRSTNSAVSQSNKVDINVNVSGGQNPEAIGQAVAQPVENAMERQLRNAMLDLTQAAPAGEF